MATAILKHGETVDVRDAEIVPHTIKENRDGSVSAEVRIIVYLDNGTTLNAVRKIRFRDDEVELD